MSDTLAFIRCRQAYHRRCTELDSLLMVPVFGTKPYAWQQEEVIAHLCCMRIPDSGLHAAPVLLVRLTGGG